VAAKKKEPGTKHVPKVAAAWAAVEHDPCPGDAAIGRLEDDRFVRKTY